MSNSPLVALVTGAGVRLGFACALELGKRGVLLALHYRSSRLGVEHLAQLLAEQGVECAIFQADLSDHTSLHHLVDTVCAHFGSLDIVVNNAGIYERQRFEDISIEDFEKMISIHLRAPFFLSQAALPALRKRGGSIINITDTDVAAPYAGYAHYFASKGGLEVLTSALACELGPEVRVNAVAPGTVAIPVGMSESEGFVLAEKLPLQRIGTPEDIAKAVVYLALDAPYVTGQVIRVDGGRVTR